MKKYLVICLLALSSCEVEKTEAIKDASVIYKSDILWIRKVRIDSTDYLITTRGNGIAIIKHGNVKP